MKGKPPQNGGPFYSRSVNGQRPSTPRPRKKTADELATQREMDAIFGEMNREHGNPVPPPKKKKKGFIRRLLGR